MDNKKNMLINAMCLYTVPEVIQMTALFSGLSESLEKAMTGFVEALSGKPASLELGSFFADELDDLVIEVIEQFHVQADVLLEEYDPQLQELEASGAWDKASQQATYFVERVPGIKSLEQLLPAKDILAYVSFLQNEDEDAQALIKFIDCFSPVFERMEAVRQEEAEQEAKNLESWFNAASTNDIATLATLFSDGIDIEARDGNDKTALAIAVRNNNLEAASYLLSEGASPVRTFSDDSPISIAIEGNYAEIVAVILSCGHEDLKEVNWDSLITNSQTDFITDKFRETIIHIVAFNTDNLDINRLATTAIKNQANKLLTLLFDYGLDANGVLNSDPLVFSAIDTGNIQTLTLLLEQGADINSKNWRDETLLEVAVKNEFVEITDLLIDSGIKLPVFNHYTSQDFMVQLAKLKGCGLDECLTLKLFDPASYDNFGRNFLHVVVSRYDDEEDSADEFKKLIDVLINDLQIDINQTTEDGDDTALTLATCESVFKILLDHKPDLNVELSYNKRVISKLTNMLDGRAIGIAIESGIDPNLMVGDESLLHYCFETQAEHISLLIAQGADLNAPDKKNLTVLQKWITDKQRVEPCLIEMAKRGADFSLNTKTGLPIFHALCANYDGGMIKEIVNTAQIDIHVSDAANNNAMMQACLAKNMSALVALSELGVDVNQANTLGGTPLLHAVYEDNVELFNELVEKCNARTDTELAGKSLSFIANQLACYDVWNLLLELDKKAGTN